MLTIKQKSDIDKLFASINKNEEFEVMFNNYKKTNKLSVVNFMKMLKFFKWKSEKEDLKMNKSSSLDIMYNYEGNNTYRVSINGTENINAFLNLVHERKNHIIYSILITQFVGKDDVTVMNKLKDKKYVIDLDDFDIRIRKSKELPVDNKTINNLANLPLSQAEKINFRYKQRITLVLDKKDNLIADLSVVKFANNVNELRKANKLYELELDYSPIGKLNRKVLNKILGEMETIKKVLINSDNLIGFTETNKVIKSYKDLVYGPNNLNFKNLYSMQPISVEVQHIVDKIPNKYSVTDKADGEKFAFYVTDGNMYLLSNNLVIRKIGSIKGLDNTILEGELIHLTSSRKYLYMVFDCLFYQGKDIRGDTTLMKRIELAKEVCSKIGIVSQKEKAKNGYKLFDAKTYGGKFNMDNIRKYYQTQIEDFYKHLNMLITKAEPNDIIFHPKLFIYPSGGESSEVFLFSDLLWTNCTENDKLNCPYHLDGIIFTGLEQKYTRDKREHQYPIYKYKPPSQNSIDVYITFERNEFGGYLEIFDNSLPDIIEQQNFRILNFMVGDTFGNKEVPIPFMPKDNNDKAYFPIERNEVRDIEGNMIQDKTVVEIIYNNNPAIPHQFRWQLLRTRWDKTESIRRDGKKYGNYKDVARKTWKSMKEAVTIEEIRNLSVPSTYDSQRTTLSSRIDSFVVTSERQQDVYYQKISNLCKEMRKFHNWLKSIIIYTYCKPTRVNRNGKFEKKSILDIGCGRGGDIQKMYHAKIRDYVGIDVDYEGINSSTDGAIVRYNFMKKKFPGYPNSVFIQADGSIPLNLKAQSNKFTNLAQSDKDKLVKTFKEGKKFDVITSQFVIHYLFDSEQSVTNLVENINQFLRNDGYVLLTLFDPGQVEKLLDGNNSYAYQYTDEEGNRNKLFEIVKKYDGKVKDKPGQSIDVLMGWINDKYNQEYLVTPELMISTMKRAGCELVDTDLFQNLYHTNKGFFTDVIDYEENPKNKKFYKDVATFYSELKGDSKGSRLYSFLNRYYVFRKTK